MSRPPSPPAPNNPHPPTTGNKNFRVRCAGCGSLLDNWLAAHGRYAQSPADIFTAHLGVSNDCIDAYRELGRVEWFYVENDGPNIANPSNEMRIESGLILSVADTAVVVPRWAHHVKSFRVRFVDARKGGERWLPGLFVKHEDATEYLRTARERAEAEVVARGVLDWRKRRDD